MGSTFLQSCVDFAATPKPWDSKEETLIHSSHSINTHWGLGNNKNEKIQFFEKLKRCQEFSLSRADWKHILLERKDTWFFNSHYLYSPEGHLPWSTPRLPGTEKCFQWFAQVQISAHGSHTGRTALLQVLSTLYTRRKRIKPKRHKNANSYTLVD